METQSSTTDIATLASQNVNGNHNEVSISYEEYKALESGFLEEKRKLEDRMWLDSNMSRFDEILRQNYDSSIRKFSEKVITYMAKITGAVYGAFFTVDYDTHTVNATGGYACTVETMERTQFNLGEGLIGQVAKSKEILCLDNVETQLDSSLGRISACFLSITPLVFNDKVYGIVELTTLNKLKPRYLILLERMSRSVAAVLQSLLNNQRTKELLIESLQQTEESKKYSDDIRQRDEALQQLREQLQRKEEELQRLIGNIQTTDAGISAEAFSKLNMEYLQAQNALEQLRQESANQQNEINQLAEMREAYSTHIEKLKVQEQTIKDLSESLHWKHEEIERQSKALQDRKAEMELLQNNLQEKEAENKRFLEEIIRQEKSLQQKEQALASLHAQLKETVANAHIPAEIAELKALVQQKESINSKLQQALELERINYVEQVESMQKASDEITEKSAKLESLEQQWNVQTQIWQSWQETAQEREEELKKNQKLIQDWQNKYTILKTEFDTEIAFGQKLESELAQLKQAYQTQNTLLSSLKEETLQKENILQQIEQDLETLKIEAQNKEQELQRLKEEIQAIDIEANQKNEAELQILRAEIQQQKLELQDLQARYSKKEDEHLVTQYMLHQMQANPLVTRETERLTKELETKEAELKRLLNKTPINTAATEVSAEILTQITEQNETIEHLKEEIKRYTEAYEALNKSFEETAEDLENVKKYVALKEDETEKLQKQIQDTQEAPEISSLVAEIRQKEALAQELQEKLNAYATPDSYIQKQYEHIQQKIKDLEVVQQHLADKEAELNYQKESIETERNNIKQANNVQQSEQNSAYNQAQEELIQLRNQIDFKQTEMQKKEQELALLFGKINTAFAMLEIDMAGKILSANNKMVFHLGLAAEEMVLEDWQKFLKPEFVESNAFKQIWSELSKVGATQIVEELIMIGRKEREVKMNITFVPILDVEGKPYEIIQIVNFVIADEQGYKKMIYGNDFTALAEEADTHQPQTNVEAEPQAEVAQNTNSSTLPTETLEFDEEREIFKAIQSSFMLLELDTEGRITNANHQIALCLGYDEAELVGKLHAELLHEDEEDSENYQEILAHLSGGHYATEVLTYLGKEKEKIKLRSYFNPLKDIDEKTRKVLVMSQYIH